MIAADAFLEYAEYVGNFYGTPKKYVDEAMDADRLIVMNDGKICGIGTHDELMKLDGKYAYMFDMQSHYYKEDAENA